MTIQNTHPRTRADLLQRKADNSAAIRAIRDRYTRNPNAILTDEETRQLDNLITERDQLEVELERLNGLPEASKPTHDRTYGLGRRSGPTVRIPPSPAATTFSATSHSHRCSGTLPQLNGWHVISMK